MKSLIRLWKWMKTEIYFRQQRRKKLKNKGEDPYIYR
jgi:hypothetical protein